MQQGTRPQAAWTLVLPVQQAGRAKSRLLAPIGVDHAGLARAIALDSLAAVRDCAVVRHRIVVTSDEGVTGAASAAGDLVIADDGHGLGAAVAAGLARADQMPAQGPVAVLLADLPALTPRDLQIALGAARCHQVAFVPDADATGTVLLTGLGPGRLPAAFGPGSAARHRALGAVRLDLQLARLRRDVDTLQDLRSAAVLGLGPRTRSVLSAAHEPVLACGAPGHCSSCG